MKYERLTHQKYDENIDLTQEYGYSYIYKRLYELEDKIEAGTLVEPSTIKQGQLVINPEMSQSKYAVICDKVERIFYAGGYYDEIEHYSVIHTIPNNVAIYYGMFDTKEAAEERCANLNKEWEEYFGEQK